MIEMLEQDICTGCHKVTGVRYFAREDVWHCEACQAYDLDSVPMVPCPNHGGAFDCTPFCELCEGDQEYLPGCNCGQPDPLPIAHDDGCPVWETARQEQEESEAAK